MLWSCKGIVSHVNRERLSRVIRIIIPNTPQIECISKAIFSSELIHVYGYDQQLIKDLFLPIKINFKNRLKFFLFCFLLQLTQKEIRQQNPTILQQVRTTRVFLSRRVLMHLNDRNIENLKLTISTIGRLSCLLNKFQYELADFGIFDSETNSVYYIIIFDYRYFICADVIKYSTKLVFLKWFLQN